MRHSKANKNMICGIIYRQHNSPEVCQTYFEETIEKFAMTNKAIYIMGDFNIDLLKSETPTELLSHSNSS